MRLRPTLDAADARRGLDAMRAELTRRGTAAVIAVADATGDALALERLDGAPASSVTIALHKAWTAAVQGVPSRALGDRVRGPERLDVAYLGDRRACGWAGGVPVVCDGVVVGSVAVSGLPEDDDEAVAEVGRRAIVAAVTPA